MSKNEYWMHIWVKESIKGKFYDWKMEENSVVDFSYYDISLNIFPFQIWNIYICVCIYIALWLPRYIYLLMVTGNFCLPHTSNIYFNSAQYLCCSALIFSHRIRFFSRPFNCYLNKGIVTGTGPGHRELNRTRKRKHNVFFFAFFFWNGTPKGKEWGRLIVWLEKASKI